MRLLILLLVGSLGTVVGAALEGLPPQEAVTTEVLPSHKGTSESPATSSVVPGSVVDEVVPELAPLVVNLHHHGLAGSEPVSLVLPGNLKFAGGASWVGNLRLRSRGVMLVVMMMMMMLCFALHCFHT